MNLFDYFDTHKVYQNGMKAETAQYLHQQISIAETAVKKEIWRSTLCHTKDINETYYRLIPEEIPITSTLQHYRDRVFSSCKEHGGMFAELTVCDRTITVYPITNKPVMLYYTLTDDPIIGFYIPNLVGNFGFGVHTANELAWTLLHLDDVLKAIEAKKNKLTEALEQLSESLVIEGYEYMCDEIEDIDDIIAYMEKDQSFYAVDMLTEYKKFKNIQKEYYDHTHQFLEICQGRIISVEN